MKGVVEVGTVISGSINNLGSVMDVEKRRQLHILIKLKYAGTRGLFKHLAVLEVHTNYTMVEINKTGVLNNKNDILHVYTLSLGHSTTPRPLLQSSQSNTYFVLLRQREIQWYILTSLVEQRLCIMYCIFCDG